MAWIPLYIGSEDLPLLNEILRSDNDLALLRHEQGDRWKAVLDYEVEADGHYSFWHKDGGPLLVPDKVRLSDIYEEIINPFEGWDQHRLNQFGQPFLNNLPSIIDLTVMVEPKNSEDSFGMSSFGWIGNYFSVLGKVAPDATKKRWTKLRREVSKIAPRVPRGWLTRDTKPEVFALPHAYKLFRTGARGAINPI
ncbi:hypothetical protein G7A66_09665 [Altererythrobacter sp. SALINAS58]|uniref:hypothetical protein n=1 Tax=Alteripontixanthobacter muriae TaxID=2705546 RepID=UPI0015774D6F|nr:hypothetical protein [Alteripontixanthobacter muriae]NTZ43346.1 hypothetical protein [Alteripontixanthobacter muriae]